MGWRSDARHTLPLGLEGRSKFKELLAAGAPRHPIGRFRPRRPGGSGTFSNFELWAPEVAVLGLLAVLAKNFLGALRAQSEGQGNLSMHPQGDNLYGYGPTTHFLAYFRLVGPCFRPGGARAVWKFLGLLEICWSLCPRFYLKNSTDASAN